ncbi:MerR family transcriptional regulator [Amycolatopsis saalfeldensis]|uniref:DNA-binding transcriptional regulator, MerR family n=1 Tax=Amycolatopsis saalfeldensis TaxID=394193 RepID=A0A1H8QWE6_9PSEU|nr:MerR family transcriptional regulator [Amycolatopsis saalfeldensis]SEO58609.1 DNA-binding transcriptional regulator, MerR family [Amycolatopsis saalfeldensis]
MAWSTRRLAELAGTSLRTVRHYHEVGLLAEPERRANGYKRYGVAHLVRLLRIKRLTDLGFSLAQIAGMGTADEHPGEAFRTLDADLAATIERLKRVRAELALILREAAPTDLPPDLAPAASDPRLSDADRSFLVVMGRVLSPSAITAYREMLERSEADPTLVEFDRLPADADERARIDLARRMAPYVRELYTRNPEVQQMKGDARTAARAVHDALVDLYNPAQVEVLARVGNLIEPPVGPG